MKGRKEHRVPLSTQVIALLDKADMELGDGEDGSLVFPLPGGQQIGINAFHQAIRRWGIPTTPHGLRSTFRDWAEEQTNAKHAAVEMSLAHVVGNRVERAYLRTDLLDQRRELMQSWADYLDPMPGDEGYIERRKGRVDEVYKTALEKIDRLTDLLSVDACKTDPCTCPTKRDKDLCTARRKWWPDVMHKINRLEAEVRDHNAIINTRQGVWDNFK